MQYLLIQDAFIFYRQHIVFRILKKQLKYTFIFKEGEACVREY